jgi:hypothetical protein
LTYDSASSLWVNANNPADGVTSITATAPLTGGTITSTGSIGLDQTALSITRSQVSDFTSGTVAQAGTATYAVNSGTAVYATNASTAVSVSGSAITQSQVVNLVSDLAGKANLAGGNAFTGAQTVTGTATASVVAVITGASGQTANLQQWQNSGGTAVARITSVGDALFQAAGFGVEPFTPYGNAIVSVNTLNQNVKGIAVRGVASQSANLLEFQNSAGDLLSRVQNNGNIVWGRFSGSALGCDTGNLLVAGNNAGVVLSIVRGAAAQTADLQQWQNSAGVVQARINPNGMGIVNAFGVAGSPDGISYAYFTTPLANQKPVVVRGAASQTANLTEWQNSGGAVLSFINQTGSISVPFLGSPTAGRSYLQTNGDTGALQVIAGSASLKAMVVQGAASQTADLLQLQNSAGTVIADFSADGALFVNNQTTVSDSLLVQRGGGTHLRLDPFNNMFATGTLTVGQDSTAGSIRLGVYAGSATVVGQIIRGAASQTADLLQLQNSAGINLGRFDASGNMVVTGATRTAFVTNIANGGAYLDLQTETPAFIQRSASAVGLLVRGAASQSGFLQTWQNSAGTDLSFISNLGNMTATDFRTTNTFGLLGESNSGGRLRMVRQTAANSSPGANVGTIYFRDGTNAGTLKLVVRAGAAGAETTILDNIPQ